MIGLIAPVIRTLVTVLIGTWITLVLAFSPALPVAWRTAAAGLSACIVLVALLSKRYRTLSQGALLSLIGLGVILWVSIKPSNDRDWVPEVKQLPWAEVDGDVVTIHNVRNFKYRSESDFDAEYDTRTYRVSELTEVDMIVTYWAGKAIAHLMVSFGFNNKDFVTFSIETRKEVGEEYSAIKGFFRNYELTYIVADERDVVGVRTNHRVPEEQTYVLRTRMALENGRKLFLEYVTRMNKLRSSPSFYNTLTTNCTTQVLMQVQALGGVATYNWKILLSGYVPDYLYETENLMQGMSFDEVMAKSLVNERAKRFADDPNFSVLIREGVPHPEPRARPLTR